MSKSDFFPHDTVQVLQRNKLAEYHTSESVHSQCIICCGIWLPIISLLVMYHWLLKLKLCLPRFFTLMLFFHPFVINKHFKGVILKSGNIPLIIKLLFVYISICTVFNFIQWVKIYYYHLFWKSGFPWFDQGELL